MASLNFWKKWTSTENVEIRHGVRGLSEPWIIYFELRMYNNGQAKEKPFLIQSSLNDEIWLISDILDHEKCSFSSFLWMHLIDREVMTDQINHYCIFKYLLCQTIWFSWYHILSRSWKTTHCQTSWILFPLQFSYHGWSTNPWLVPLTSSLVASGMSGSLISRPMNSSIFAWPIVYQCTYTSICLVITKQYIQYNQQYNQNSNPANSVSTAFMYIYEPIEPSLPGNVSPCTIELRNQMQNVEMFWKETSFFIIAITMILASFDLGISPYWKRSCSGSKRNSWIEIKNKGRSLAQIMRKNIE